MCDVCVAEAALKSGLRGIEISWSDAPAGARTLIFRAQGAGAEFKPAKYQLAVKGDGFPESWEETKDLASVVARYGLDKRWRSAPSAVRNWVIGVASMPSFFDLNPGISRI